MCLAMACIPFPSRPPSRPLRARSLRIVRRRVEVIYAEGSIGTLAARGARIQIPIVGREQAIHLHDRPLADALELAANLGQRLGADVVERHLALQEALRLGGEDVATH